MRLFVALELPEHLRDELDRRTHALRGKLPKARWVRPQAMHLTLSFLGETESERLDDLRRELAVACATAVAMELRLHEIGAFPPRGKARVLWAGLAGADGRPSPALAHLRTAVAEAVERAAGVAPETRPFHPHLTLARCAPPWPRDALERFLSDFGALPDEAFTVAEGVLFESELHPAGACYRVVGSYPLGGCDPLGDSG